MMNIDWIPVLCRTINRTDVGRLYMSNRLKTLRTSLQGWVEDQQRYCRLVDNYGARPAVRKLAEKFRLLVANELAFLHIALADMEVWSEGGADLHLNKAQSAYERAQRIWKQRLKMLRQIAGDI